jgi:SAM-dependent methyltransferase
VRHARDAEARAFRVAYAEHRAREGRGPLAAAELLALPYLDRGPFAREWQVRARSFDAFVREVLEPLARLRGGRLRVLDLGAGNGWISYRMVQRGHRAVALDVRTDSVDGLGAATAYRPHLPALFARVAASFERIPFAACAFDLAVFNASLHYARELAGVVREAARVLRPGGRLVVLDSPFYETANAGEAMVREKRAGARGQFGELVDVLQAPRFVEYLTRGRLEAAAPRLDWKRVPVRYPLWYEARPLLAAARGAREPSRFDVWWAEVA